jgi:trehalose 6-phosphate synthase
MLDRVLRDPARLSDQTPIGGRMPQRVILISNRVTVPTQGRATAPGGLAVAVKAALKQRSGIWFGWSGNATDEPTPEPKIIERNRTTYAVIDLSVADYQEYYNGFANRVLWPILHYRVDLAEYSHSDLGGYQRVNKIFAEHVSRILQPDDIVWVHDYHLMPLAQELRARGHENQIGFFLHIPCPPPDILLTLPRHEEILGVLPCYDLVGFQTENDRENFGRYLQLQGATAGRDGMTYQVKDRSTRIGVFPVGIETSVLNRLASNAGRSAFTREFKDSLAGCKLIVGVDRLDYSKGLQKRLEGFDRFLAAHPEWHGRVTYLQIAPTSRSEIKEYVEINRMVDELVGQINGRYGEASWTPIRYINRSYSRTALSGIYRAADVGLVTPLRDGMNLVAKEFIATQDAEDPGVLILSQFAGAAAELDAAVLINPHEADAFADAILQALEMPLEDRIERHAKMYKQIARNNVDRWANSFLASLAETQKRPGLLEGIKSLFNPRPREA